MSARERIRGVIGEVAESAFAGGMDAEAAYRDSEDAPDYRNDKNAAADSILAIVREALLTDAAIDSFQNAEAGFEHDQFDGWFQAYQAGMKAALDKAFGADEGGEVKS